MKFGRPTRSEGEPHDSVTRATDAAMRAAIKSLRDENDGDTLEMIVVIIDSKERNAIGARKAQEVPQSDEVVSLLLLQAKTILNSIGGDLRVIPYNGGTDGSSN